MNSIKEVYGRLKQHDIKKQLTLIDNDTLELKINDEDKVCAYDTIIDIWSQGKTITHLHYDEGYNDYEEIYCYFYNVMKGIIKIPTNKEFKKEQRQGSILFAISLVTAVLLGCLIGGFIGGILVIPLIFISFMIFDILRRIILNLGNPIDKKDLNIIKQFYNLSIPSSIFKSDLCLKFSYMNCISNKFLKFPKKIHLPYSLELNDEEKNEFEKIKASQKELLEKNSEWHIDLYETLCEYYQASLEVPNIVSKYYDENGNRKKL